MTIIRATDLLADILADDRLTATDRSNVLWDLAYGHYLDLLDGIRPDGPADLGLYDLD